MRKSKKQLRGQCIFCGGGNLSKEHFWPEWAAPLLPSYPAVGHVEHRITMLNKTPNGHDVRNKQGNTWTKKIRVVCVSCNTGWMSQLETAAKPFLIPLINGTACLITDTMSETIARWITLKILVGEHNIKGEAVATAEERKRFRDTFKIPDNLHIWIGRCGEGGWQTAYWRHSATLSLSPDIKPEHKFKNTHTVTFGIGNLLVSVCHTTVPNLVFDFGYDQHGMSSLYPIRGSNAWPTPKRLTSGQATHLAHALEGLIRSKNVMWKPLD